MKQDEANGADSCAQRTNDGRGQVLVPGPSANYPLHPTEATHMPVAFAPCRILNEGKRSAYRALGCNWF